MYPVTSPLDGSAIGRGAAIRPDLFIVQPPPNLQANCFGPVPYRPASRPNASSAADMPRNEIGSCTPRPSAARKSKLPLSVWRRICASTLSDAFTSATHNPGRHRRQLKSTFVAARPAVLVRLIFGAVVMVTLGATTSVKANGCPAAGRPIANCAITCPWFETLCKISQLRARPSGWAQRSSQSPKPAVVNSGCVEAAVDAPAPGAALFCCCAKTAPEQSPLMTSAKTDTRILFKPSFVTLRLRKLSLRVHLVLELQFNPRRGDVGNPSIEIGRRLRRRQAGQRQRRVGQAVRPIHHNARDC